MGFLIRAFVVAISLGVAILIQNYRNISRPLPPPELSVTQYWGPGSGANYKEDKTVKPFDITAKPELIDDLKAYLNRPLKLHEPLEGVGFRYGFNSNELVKLVKYWRDRYLPKWNEHEAFLKQYPHYETQIQGLRVHFMHVKPKSTEGKKVVPLLLLHGWPGSIREFYGILPLLTKSNSKSDYVFEVIVPSLPGYGWSQGASKVNFGPAQLAVVLRNLMLRVGHEKFVVQGGDWGSIIGASMGAIFPENVIAYHSNMCGNMSPLANIKMLLRSFFPSWFVKTEHADFFKPLGKQLAYLIEESGYMHIQATKPDTIGTTLSFNPVGLAAYIIEKFSSWTDAAYRDLEDGGLTKRFTLDALLDNVMIYYVTNSITTSQRLYAEAFTSEQMKLNLDRVPLKMPTGCARFKHDLVHSTDCELKDRFINLIHSTYHQNGGHFAAMELPQEFYEDFVQFTNKALKPNNA